MVNYIAFVVQWLNLWLQGLEILPPSLSCVNLDVNHLNSQSLPHL